MGLFDDIVDAPLSRAPVSNDGPGLFSELLDFGEGALFGLLDVLDRPGRSVRHLLSGNFGQALEAFDPFNLFTEQESTPISGRDVLQNLGFVGENAEGLDFSDVAGFGAEIALDPLTWVGGFIGKAISAPLSRAAGSATRFAEGLSGAGIPGRPAAQRGGALKAFLEASGGKIPLAGAALGATGGFLAAEEGEGLGGALGGALLGGIGGAAALGAPKIAGLGLDVGDTFSKRFRLTRRTGREAAARQLKRDRLLNGAIRKHGAAAGARLKKHLDLLDAQIREGIEGYLHPITGAPVETAEDLARVATDLSEQVGFGRTVALRDEPEALFGRPGTEATLDIQRGRQAELPGLETPLPSGPETTQKEIFEFFEKPPEVGVPVTQEAGALRTFGLSGEVGVTGPDQIKTFLKQYDEAPEAVRVVLDDIWRTGGSRVLLGKAVADEVQVGKSILTREFLDEFRKTHKLERVIHVEGAEDSSEFLRGLIGALDEVDESIAKTAVLSEKLTAASRLGSGTTKGILARRLVGSIRELNEKVPGLLEHNFAKLGAIESRQVGTRLAARDMLVDAFNDPTMSKPLVDVVDEAGNVIEKAATKEELDSLLWRAAPKGVVGKEMSELLGGRVINVALHDHLFDPKRGLAKRLLDRDAPSKVAKAWKRFNGAWSRITLGPFTSWWGRNLTGNFFNSYLSLGLRGMLGHHKEAMRVQNALGKYIRNEAIEGSITVGKETMSLEKFVGQIWDDAVPQTGLAATEAGEGVLQAMSLPELLEAGKQRLKNPGQTVKDMIRADSQQNFFIKSGFGINSVLEDYMRIHHYVAKRAATGSRGEAAESTIRALGDMRDLSPGDEAARMVMPFWAWTRFNVPRQIRGIFERPNAAGLVGRMKLNMDKEHRVDVPDSVVPDWLQGQLAVPISRKDGKLTFYSFNRWHPLADLFEIDSPKKFMKFLVNSLGPAQKTILEQSLGEGGFNAYFGKAIERYPGERDHFLGMDLQKRWIHVLRNLRLLSGLDEVTRKRVRNELEPLSFGQKVLKSTINLKPRTVDLRSQRKRKIKKLRSDVGKFRNLAARSRRAKDFANQANFLRLMQEARDELGLLTRWQTELHPLVPQDR